MFVFFLPNSLKIGSLNIFLLQSLQGISRNADFNHSVTTPGLESLPSDLICEIFSRLDDIGSRMSFMYTSKTIMSAIQSGSSLCWSNARQLIVNELVKPHDNWPHGNKVCISLLGDLIMLQPKSTPGRAQRPFPFPLARLLLFEFINDPVLDHHDNCRMLILSLALAGDVAFYNALTTKANVQGNMFPKFLSDNAFCKGLLQRAVLSGNIALIEAVIRDLTVHLETSPSSWSDRFTKPTAALKHIYAQKSYLFQIAVASGNVDVILHLIHHKDVGDLFDAVMVQSCITIACFHNQVNMLAFLTMTDHCSIIVPPQVSKIDEIRQAVALNDINFWCYNMTLAARHGNAKVLKWFRVSFPDQFLDLSGSNHEEDFLTVDDLCLFANASLQRFNDVLCELLLCRWFGDALGKVMRAENCALLNASIVCGNLKIVQMLRVLGMTKTDIHPASVPSSLEMFVELRDNWQVSGVDIDISSMSIYSILGCETQVIVELRKHWGASEAYRTLKDVGFNSEHRAYWIASVFRHKRAQISTLVELRDHWGFTSEHVRSCRNYALLTAVSMDNVYMVRHMKTVWGINAADALECNAIEEAVSHASINVLEGLCNIFGIEAADVRRCKNYALSCVFTSYPHESWKIIKMLRIFRESYGLDSAADLRCFKENPVLTVAAKRGDVGVMVELLRGWNLTADDARVNENEILRNVVSGFPRNVSVAENVKLLKLLRYGFGLSADDMRYNAVDNTFNSIQKAYHGDILAELREGWGMNADDVRGHGISPESDFSILVRNCVDDNDLSVFSELRQGYNLDSFDLARINFAPLRTAAFYALPEFLNEFSQWPRLSDAIAACSPDRQLVLRCFPGAESMVRQHLQAKAPGVVVQSYVDRGVFDDCFVTSDDLEAFEG